MVLGTDFYGQSPVGKPVEREKKGLTSAFRRQLSALAFAESATKHLPIKPDRPPEVPW